MLVSVSMPEDSAYASEAVPDAWRLKVSVEVSGFRVVLENTVVVLYGSVGHNQWIS